MCILLDKLKGGAITAYRDATDSRVHFSRMSPLSARKLSQTTKLGIISPLSIIARMSKSWYYHDFLSVSDSLHGFFKHILSHMGTCVP